MQLTEELVRWETFPVGWGAYLTRTRNLMRKTLGPFKAQRSQCSTGNVTLCNVLCLVAQWCLTLCNSMDCSPSGSSVWGGLPCLLPGDLPNLGMEPRSPALLVDSLPSKPPGKPKNTGVGSLSLLQGVFLTPKSSQGLLHGRQILYQLSYQGGPDVVIPENNSFVCGYPVFLAPFVEKITPSPLNGLGKLVENQLTHRCICLVLDSQFYSSDLSVYIFFFSTSLS